MQKMAAKSRGDRLPEVFERRWLLITYVCIIEETATDDNFMYIQPCSLYYLLLRTTDDVL